jgi:hypothetical protein
MDGRVLRCAVGNKTPQEKEQSRFGNLG